VSFISEQDELSDGALVKRALAGDEEAFALLVRRYQKAAYAVALSVTRKHEDAEDAAQESFLVALDRLEECRNPEKFGGWFLTMVRNRSRNLLRRESLREGDPLPFALATSEGGPDRKAERSELRSRLTAALGELDEVQREVVLLHDLEGWKHREIAEKLNMPAGTVRSHLHYARKRLRGYLEGMSEVGPEEGGR
jgi:RNA polymerase sigma-70 factor, ECF subfamily